MNTKAALLFVFLFAVAVQSWAEPLIWAPDPPLGTVRNINAMNSMFFATKTGWFLQIFSDGSGNLQFGSSGGDNAKFPAGSFDFANVISSLVSQSTLDSDDLATGISVILQRRNSSEPAINSDIMQTVRRELGKSIFERAASVAKAQDTKRFEELKRDRPFVAGK